MLHQDSHINLINHFFHLIDSLEPTHIWQCKTRFCMNVVCGTRKLPVSDDVNRFCCFMQRYVFGALWLWYFDFGWASRTMQYWNVLLHYLNNHWWSKNDDFHPIIWKFLGLMQIASTCLANKHLRLEKYVIILTIWVESCSHILTRTHGGLLLLLQIGYRI